MVFSYYSFIHSELGSPHPLTYQTVTPCVSHSQYSGTQLLQGTSLWIFQCDSETEFSNQYVCLEYDIMVQFTRLICSSYLPRIRHNGAIHEIDLLILPALLP